MNWKDREEMHEMVRYELAKSHVAELQAEAAAERLARRRPRATSPDARNALVASTLIPIVWLASQVLRLANVEPPTPRSTSAPCG